MNHQLCRCCLIEHPPISYNIFERENLRLDLMECVPSMRIEPNDGLPDFICDLCWLRVREAVEFKRKCEEADRVLRSNCHSKEAVVLRPIETEREHNPEKKKIETENALNSEEAILYNATLELCELSPLEVSLLNEVLLEDWNNPSSSTNFIRDEDPVIVELLNSVLPDETSLPAAAAAATNETRSPAESSFHQSADITSTTCSTTSVVNAKRRQRNTTKQLQHICTECGKKFTRNFQLKLHLNSVHNVGDGLQYQCNVCQKTFASRHSLSYHQKSLHTEERDFACSQCERRFVLRSQLASHERMHTGELKPRIFDCPKCGKTWPTKSDLRTHMRSHDPNVERRFQCDHPECGKRFYTRGHLASHLLVHSGAKPFACALCEKSYQSIGNLNNHMVKRHSEVVLSRSRQRNGDQRTIIES